MRLPLWRVVLALRWASAVGHGLYVWSVLERLVEVADAACDVGVARDGQRDDGL
jgi:hypothetical protein